MVDESNALDHLISQVEDVGLRDRLAREINFLRGSRHFGLVFDRHLPESVRLLDHPIRKGIRVALRDESSEETWTVDHFTDHSRDVAVLDGEGGERHISELAVVREFGEPVYPGFRSIERIANGPVESPWHVVINGENYHALQVLKLTHREKVDLIYIDPPYNTGNDGWIYNDKYVDHKDRAKSSKWLSFLERRLLIARDLLKPTGVIIVSIGDDEHHRLRMLLDQILGDKNFIMNVAWQGGVSALSRHHGGGLDYMLVYGRDATKVGQFRDPKPLAPEMLKLAAEAISAGKSAEEAQKMLRDFIRTEGKDLPPGVRRFNRVDEDGEVFLEGDLANSLYRPNLRYALTDPATGRSYDPPKNGWSVGQEKMAELISQGRIIFDGDRIPTRKRLLREQMLSLASPSFYRDRRTATNRLAEQLGDRRFPFPKDHTVLMRWFRMAAPKNAVILDFFGGSGTTTEAVIQLNAEDGGSRQSILVTNNEIGAKEAKKLRKEGVYPGDLQWESRGVFEYVCRPRVSTAVTGVRPDGSEYSGGLSANVEMFDLTYLDPGMVRRGNEFKSIAPLLWLQAGARGEQIQELSQNGWKVTGAYGVLFDIDYLAEFAAAIGKSVSSDASPNVVFIITDSPAEYRQAAERIPSGIETVQLFEDYLNYMINTEDGAR